jgi:hypothetical protein
MWNFFKRGGWLVMLGVAAIIAAGWLYLSTGNRLARLAEEGVTVTATITEMHELVTQLDGIGRRSSDSETTDYFATVTYLDPTGARQTVEQSVSKTWYDTWFPNQQVDIRVLPDDPSVVAIDPGHQQTSGNVGALALIAAGVVAMGTGWLLHRQMAGRAALGVTGVPATAQVMKLVQNGAFQRVKYSFTVDGTLYTGLSLPKGDGRYAALKPGDGFAVRYDAARPRRNAAGIFDPGHLFNRGPGG